MRLYRSTVSYPEITRIGSTDFSWPIAPWGKLPVYFRGIYLYPLTIDGRVLKPCVVIGADASPAAPLGHFTGGLDEDPAGGFTPNTHAQMPVRGLTSCTRIEQRRTAPEEWEHPS